MAPQDGKVDAILAGTRGGNAILISNNDGSMSGFAHTQVAPGLSVGDTVTEGSVIGTSDGSGTGNAPHLHLTYQKGTPANPATRSTPTSDPMTTQYKNAPASDTCTKTASNPC